MRANCSNPLSRTVERRSSPCPQFRALPQFLNGNCAERMLFYEEGRAAARSRCSRNRLRRGAHRCGPIRADRDAAKRVMHSSMTLKPSLMAFGTCRPACLAEPMKGITVSLA